MDDDARTEKRWKMMQQILAAEARGDEMKPLVSKRTLFGIKSSIEETIDRVMEEDTRRRLGED